MKGSGRRWSPFPSIHVKPSIELGRSATNIAENSLEEVSKCEGVIRPGPGRRRLYTPLNPSGKSSVSQETSKPSPFKPSQAIFSGMKGAGSDRTVQMLTQLRLARLKVKYLSQRISQKISTYERVGEGSRGENGIYLKEVQQLSKLRDVLERLEVVLEIAEIRFENLVETGLMLESIPPVIEALRSFRGRDLLAMPEISALLEPLFSWDLKLNMAVRPESEEVRKILAEAEIVARHRAESEGLKA